jgi:hypothetical protein
MNSTIKKPAVVEKKLLIQQLIFVVTEKCRKETNKWLKTAAVSLTLNYFAKQLPS